MRVEMLEGQRAAFVAELPVSLAIRRDRLRRAIAMIDQNGASICAAFVGDDQAHESAMQTEIASGVAVLGDSLRNVARWMRLAGGRDFVTRLVRGDSDTEYQPVGVVGLMPPRVLPLFETASMLAGALAAGNRVVIGFDSASARLGSLLAELAPRYFDPLELAVIRDEGGLAGMEFDLLATGGMENEPRLAGSAALAHPAKSPVIIGRSADFAKAADRVIASKFAKPAGIPLAPDYLLVPEEQEEAVAAWLLRAARRFPHEEANIATSCGEMTRLIADARARGGEVLVAAPDGASDAQTPLYIIRHATARMLVMQEEIRGPILPLCNYRHIDDAIQAIQRRGVPLGIYYFGRDRAERRHVLDRTISSAVAVNGGALAMATRGLPVSGSGTTSGSGQGEGAFRRFSRARRVYRQRAWSVAQRQTGEAARELGVAAPALH
jgi:coniferyl-aldehyde dehydrogenase